MDAEGLGRKLLLTPSGDPRRAPEKQTVGTGTASHKMLTLQAVSSSLNAGTAKRGCLGRGEAFGCPSAICPPKRPRPFAHYRLTQVLFCPTFRVESSGPLLVNFSRFPSFFWKLSLVFIRFQSALVNLVHFSEILVSFNGALDPWCLGLRWGAPDFCPKSLRNPSK